MDRVFRPFRLQPPLVVPKLNRLFLRAYRHDQPSGCRTHLAGFRSTSLGLRLSPAGSPRRQAESSSCSSGLVIHLPMLSTSRCREAVSFGYRTRFRPDGDSHPAGSIHLQTHWRTPPGVRIDDAALRPAFARLEACATEDSYGTSSPSGSLVQGMRLETSSSPAAQPAIMPTVSAMARTRGKTWAFSGGNCDL